MFVRETSEPLTSLVKKIDQRMQAAVGQTPNPVGAYVMFMHDRSGLDQNLRDLAKQQALERVPLGIGAPPKDYEVAPGADITVVVYGPEKRGLQHVTANFALRKGELTDAKIDDIVKAISAVLPPLTHTVVAHSKERPQTWRYTVAKPNDDWFQSDFDDLSWKSGPGGFGAAGAPEAKVRTVWNTSDIWLRRAFTLPEGPFTDLRL